MLFLFRSHLDFVRLRCPSLRIFLGASRSQCYNHPKNPDASNPVAILRTPKHPRPKKSRVHSPLHLEGPRGILRARRVCVGHRRPRLIGSRKPNWKSVPTSVGAVESLRWWKRNSKCWEGIIQKQNKREGMLDPPKDRHVYIYIYI